MNFSTQFFQGRINLKIQGGTNSFKTLKMAREARRNFFGPTPVKFLATPGNQFTGRDRGVHQKLFRQVLNCNFFLFLLVRNTAIPLSNVVQIAQTVIFMDLFCAKFKILILKDAILV